MLLQRALRLVARVPALGRRARARSTRRQIRERARRRAESAAIAPVVRPRAAAIRPRPNSRPGRPPARDQCANIRRLSSRVTGLEQRLGEIDARRQIAGRRGQRLLRNAPRRPHAAPAAAGRGIEILPFEVRGASPWRARKPGGPAPIAPRRAAHGRACRPLDVRRPGDRILVGARDAIPRRGRIRVEREARQCRKRRLGRRAGGRSDNEDGERNEGMQPDEATHPGTCEPCRKRQPRRGRSAAAADVSIRV